MLLSGIDEFDEEQGEGAELFQQWKPQPVPLTVDQRRLQREAVRLASAVPQSTAPQQGAAAAPSGSTPCWPRPGSAPIPATARSSTRKPGPSTLVAMRATRQQELLGGSCSCGALPGGQSERRRRDVAVLGNVRQVADTEALEARLEEVKKKVRKVGRVVKGWKYHPPQCHTYPGVTPPTDYSSREARRRTSFFAWQRSGKQRALSALIGSLKRQCTMG